MKSARLVLQLLLVGAMLAACDGGPWKKLVRRYRAPAAPTLVRGQAILPLTGLLAPLGVAFREGFAAGLAADSAQGARTAWEWTWADNASDPEATRLWLESAERAGADILLAGLAGAVTDIAMPEGLPLCLWLGDGDRRNLTPAVWPLWPSNAAAAELLATWADTCPGPLAILSAASSSWTPVIEEELLPRLRRKDVVIIPHEIGEERYWREADALLSLSPRSVLAWHPAADARALFAIARIASLLDQARVLLPPQGGPPRTPGAVSLRFDWAPSYPFDPVQIAFWRSWGEAVGRQLAAAASAGAPAGPSSPASSVGRWREVLSAAAPVGDVVRPPGGGWAPPLALVPMSAASMQPVQADSAR